MSLARNSLPALAEAMKRCAGHAVGSAERLLSLPVCPWMRGLFEGGGCLAPFRREPRWRARYKRQTAWGAHRAFRCHAFRAPPPEQDASLCM